MHLYRGGTRGGDLALHPIGTEADLRVALTLQNFAMHAPVANAAAALPGGCVHNDQPLNGAGIRIEGDFATLQLEGTVNGVQAVTDGERDPGLGGGKMQQPRRGLGRCHQAHQEARHRERKPRPYANWSCLSQGKAHHSLLRWQMLLPRSSSLDRHLRPSSAEAEFSIRNLPSHCKLRTVSALVHEKDRGSGVGGDSSSRADCLRGRLHRPALSYASQPRTIRYGYGALLLPGGREESSNRVSVRFSATRELREFPFPAS